MKWIAQCIFCQWVSIHVPFYHFLFFLSIAFSYCTFSTHLQVSKQWTQEWLCQWARVWFRKGCLRRWISNEEDMENDDLPPDLLRLVEQDERQILPHQEITEAINLGIEEERKEVKIRTTLSLATRTELIDLLQDYSDVFAWSYQDMPGLDTDIVVHRLPLKEECMPVK